MKKKFNMFVLSKNIIIRTFFISLSVLLGFVFSISNTSIVKGSELLMKASICMSIPQISKMPKVSFSPTLLFIATMPSIAISNEINENTLKVQEEIPEILPQSIDEKTYQKTSEKGYTSTDGIYINNQTDFTVDVASLLNAPVSFAKTDNKPLVLILHTHTSESYTPTQTFNYTPTDTDRTEDKNFNVVRVGNVIEEKLRNANIGVIHDETSNDYPSYNGSYQKALNSIEYNLKQNPSIKIILDIHRDYIENQSGEKVKAVCNIGEEKSAQVMLVIGTSGSGLNHPNWHENLSFALKVQKSMVDSYPSLARPINLRKSRFNGHTAPGAMIVEVGTSGNTLEEAMKGADLFCDSLIKVINEL